MEVIIDFFENIFADWNTQTFLVALFLAAIPISIAWFVHIPSFGDGAGGLKFIHKIAITIVMPIAIVIFINKKKK